MNGDVFSTIDLLLVKSPSFPDGPVIKGGVSSTSATIIVNVISTKLLLSSW